MLTIMSIESRKGVRRVLAIIPVLPVIVVAVIVIVALTPSGAWLDISRDAEPSVEVNGAYLDAEVPVLMASHMPYALEDLSFQVTLVDEVRGSYQTVISSAPTDIPGNGTGTLTLESHIFAPTLYLVMGDLIERQGSILRFEVTASCGYLLGLADFTLDAVIDVPLAEGDGVVTYGIVENSDDAFEVRIDGLRSTLMPDDSVYILSGGGSSLSVHIRSSDGSLILSVTSTNGLDAAIATLLGSEGKVFTGSEGPIQVDDEDLDMFLEALNFVRGTV